MKKFIADGVVCGVPMDANFISHTANCANCKQFDAAAPATFALLCLEGSVLWKRENTDAPKREPLARGQFETTTKHAKELMRYK